MLDRPNHLRAMLFERGSIQLVSAQAVLLEANVDNMNPEWCGYLTERLLAANALDVWYTPVTMKKGRPAFVVSVLCALTDREQLESIVLRESTTIGLRRTIVDRRVLDRRHVTVETEYGAVRIKEAFEAGVCCNAAPEFEDCRNVAQTHDIPLKDVYRAALAAYHRQQDSGKEVN